METFTSNNGIRFFLVEDRELPLIDVNVTIRTGGVLDPADKAGLASLAGTIIRSGGTKDYPADELNALLENKAARMETGIGFTSGSASMNVLKEDFDDLLPVFINLLTNPAFPEDKIKLAKTQTKSSISRRNDDAQQIGFREFERLIYGPNTVYGHTSEYETINNITREDLVSFHNQHFVSQNLMVGVVGDFRTETMRKKLRQAFGSIPSGTATELNFPKVNYEYNSSINFIDKPDVNQSVVLLGHIGDRRRNPDYAKIQVMNQVLSNGFSGRLMKIVRSELGLAYAVFGQFGMNSFYPGMFYAGVMTKSSTTADAIDAIIKQLKRLQEEPVSKSELRDVKDQFLNSMVFRYDSYEKVLNSRMSDAYHGLSEDAFDQYVEKVKATTIKDIQEVARNYLRPDQLQILVVGNSDEIGNQLEKYGIVNKIDITIPQPGSSMKPAVTGDDAKGEKLINKMKQALIPDYKGVAPLTISGEVTQFGPELPGGQMAMNLTSTIDYPNAVEQTLVTPGGTMNLSFKNGSGTITIMGQEQPLPPHMARDLKKTLKRHYVSLAINHQNLNPLFTGTEIFEGKEYARVNINIDGDDIALLIDEETGYPRLMRFTEFDPQQGKTVDKEERYSEWTVQDGVAYAYKEISFSDGEKSSEAIYKNHEVSVGSWSGK